MKTVPLAVHLGIIGLMLALLTSGGRCSEPRLLPYGAEAQAEQSEVAAGMPTYNPPRRGAPASRVGGGTRGGFGGQLTLSALAPDHTGLTIHEQPALYWYLARATTSPVEVTLTTPQNPKPLLEIRLSPPLQRGIQRVRLADYGIHLAPGVLYKWAVALVLDPTQRSQDITTSGKIERTTLSDELRTRLSRTSKARLPYLYAEASLWYDAIAAISDLIDAAPRDTALRQQRAALLEQARLPQVAAYDKQVK